MRPSSERSRSSPLRERKPSSTSKRYGDSVFINCPFDADYQRIFRAVIFAVHDCGFVARSALEVSDSSQNRLGKIISIIENSQFGIHDISRTQLDAAGYPRFNMPLELGLFLGCKAFGGVRQRNKNCLVLDKSRYRYRRFISDISGQDIESHGGTASSAIAAVRDWLSVHSDFKLPSGLVMFERYQSFSRQLSRLCEVAQTDSRSLTYAEYIDFVTEWLLKNERSK